MASEVVLNESAFQELSATAIKYIIERTALKVEGAAKQLCPVDTGRLRASITHEVEGEGLDVVARIGTNVSYAPYQELGTRHMPPHPFLRPALGSVHTTFGLSVSE